MIAILFAFKFTLILGDFTNFHLGLSYNNLTRFEEAVFRPVLEQMLEIYCAYCFVQLDESKYIFLCVFLFISSYIYSKLLLLNQLIIDPFDCKNDPCHLTWILRDNTKFLRKVSGTCSDGRSFSSIKPSDEMFIGCP